MATPRSPRNWLTHTRAGLFKHLLTAMPLVLAMWACYVPLAHARRGFPLFIIISDNPILLVLGLGLVGVWGYFRFARDDA